MKKKKNLILYFKQQKKIIVNKTKTKSDINGEFYKNNVVTVW